MLEVVADADDPGDVGVDVLVVPVFKGGIEGPGTQQILARLGLDEFPVTPEFRGEVDQHLLLASPGLRCSAVLLVGLGRMDETDPARLRRVAGGAARAAARFATLATTLAEVHPTPAAVQAVAEGLHLGAYEDRRFRSTEQEEQPRLRRATVLVPSARLADAQRAVARAARYAGATLAARDLVNTPPDRKRPPQLADALGELAGHCCDVRIRDEAALADGGFAGVLAVGRGSSAPPRLVELRYQPESPLGHIVLVGKGITFDTGGLSLKKPNEMADMKSDMAGAAAVAAACSVLGELNVRVQVTALLPLAENALGGDAQRPGDVLRMYDGTTVEVLDTDAEGRLVLGDALAHARTLAPDAIVDLATLTGAATTAVGQYAAALFGSNDDLVQSICTAADFAGERVWRLPLWPELERFLDTPVADLNNTGDGAGGGSIMGALFLQRFVRDTPWAHLDIAGPAFLAPEQARGELTPGATGFGVRTLLAWLEHRAI